MSFRGLYTFCLKCVLHRKYCALNATCFRELTRRFQYTEICLDNTCSEMYQQADCTYQYPTVVRRMQLQVCFGMDVVPGRIDNSNIPDKIRFCAEVSFHNTPCAISMVASWNVAKVQTKNHSQCPWLAWLCLTHPITQKTEDSQASSFQMCNYQHRIRMLRPLF